MKKIIVGFDNEPVLIKIKDEMKKLGITDTVFAIKTSKLAVLDAIENEEPFACLITESIGFEHWTLEEIAEIRDSYNVHIVPIISSEYKGTASIQQLYLSGITSALLKKPKKALKASEIAKLLITSRTLKDARIYYGIAKLEDIKVHPDTLSEEELEKYKTALRDSSLGATIGQRFIKVVERLTSKQTQVFIDSLPKSDITSLAEFEEFYTVLDILKKAGIVYKYKKPRHLKKHDNKIIESEKGDVIDQNGEEIIRTDPLFEDELSERPNEETEYYFEGDDMDNSEEYLGDDEYSFANEEDESEQFGFSDMQPEEGEEPETMDIPVESEDAVISEQDIEEALEQSSASKDETTVIRQIIEEEEAKEAEKELVNNRTYLVVTFAGIAVLFFILLVLFVHITIQRNQKQQQAEKTENIGFDVSYGEMEDETVSLNTVDLVNKEDETLAGNEEEPEPEPELDEIEMVIARHDPPVTVSENGNTVQTPGYVTVSAQNENSTEQQETSNKTNAGNVSVEGAAAAVQNTFSDRKNDATSNNRADVPVYNYKPDKLTSNYTNVSFQDGEKIDGLKLVNALNAGSGTDCKIRLKSGIEIAAGKGEASPQDIPIRSTFLTEKKNNLLIFTEQ